VIGTVLGFACHDHLIGNHRRANIHMNGLEKIIRTRGGYGTLKPFHPLRLMIFWIDVADSFLTDKKPRFPLQEDIILDLSNQHRFGILDSITTAWENTFTDFIDITVILASFARIAQFINDHAGTPNFWRHEWFVPLKFLPILQRLLSLPRDEFKYGAILQGSVLREALRLTCLILSSLVMRKCRVRPDGVSEYKSRVMKLLIDHPVIWFPFWDLRLWVLVVAGLIAEGECRAWHVAQISCTMDQIGLNTWNEAIEVAKSIIWIDELLDDEASKLGSDIEQFRNLI